MQQFYNYVFAAIGMLSVGQLYAQSSNNTAIGDLNEQIQVRQEIRTGRFGGIHTSMKPLFRQDVRSYQDSVDPTYWLANRRRQEQYAYIRNDNNDLDTAVKSKEPFMKFVYPNRDKSFLSHFYKTPAHLLEIRKKHFYVNVNPIIHVSGGLEQVGGRSNITFLNRRGAAIRGNIANRVFFHTDIIETQAVFPEYIQKITNRDNAVPGAGFYKKYNGVFTADSIESGVDYLLATGYISFDLLKEHIGMQIGHGQHFLGDGHRSLFLSDYSPNYFYVKFNTRVWKLHYQNIFAQLTENYTIRQRAFDLAFGRKYLAAHHLSINVLDNLNIGLFEGVMFSRGGQFDLQYLNPLIFYRAVEQAAGSPDNVMIGLNWKWNFLSHFSFYGQLVLDELAIGSLVQNGWGWWGNKFAVQAGVKYIDAFGVDQLDFQAEFNMARPFIYTFRDSSANWTHYNQPLAHPMGANFYEIIGIVKYQPLPNLFLRGQLNYAIYGQDEINTNWGSNVHKSYNTRQLENNNVIGQGVTTQLLMLQLQASYQIRHNMFLDLEVMYRRDDANVDSFDNSTVWMNLGFRWNITSRQYDW
jgi:hypothetical protein